MKVGLLGSKEDFREVISQAGFQDVSGDAIKLSLREYSPSKIRDDYDTSFVGSPVVELFFAYLGAAERLALADPARRGDYIRNGPDRPLQWLEFDEDAESQISAVFERAFGSRLILNTLAGDHLLLHVIPSSEEGLSAMNARDHARWLASQPPLHRQGDGMRSFTGAVLSLLVHPRNVVLIDEPEAFLHPPQARRLAEVVARETSPESQLIVATHNDAFIRALLDASGNRVIVSRIVRDGARNVATLLRSDQIIELWTDPSLRTSDVLSALFHDVAVICEGDSDVRFFRTLLDETKGETRDLDARFYHFGGKERGLCA